MNDSEYRALELESYSSLKYLLDSVDSFKHHKEKPFMGSLYTLLGTAVHHYIQGNRHLVTVCPIDGRKKKELDKFTEDWLELKTDPEAILVPVGFGPKLEVISKNIQENVYLPTILEGCEFEVPCQATLDGVPVKGKCDAFNKDIKVLVEIKTSSKANNLETFREEAYERHYDLQAALYFKLYGAKQHYFVVVNTTEPYSVSVYRTSAAMLKSGEEKLKTVLERYTRYIVNGEEEFQGIPEV
jgi:hypothetical protein